MRVFFAIESDAGLDSRPDERFARAPYFLIYDLETQKTISVERNPYLNQEHGVGIQVANHVIQNNCQIAVGSQFGPKAQSVLKTGGIRMLEAESGSIRDVLEKIRTI